MRTQSIARHRTDWLVAALGVIVAIAVAGCGSSAVKHRATVASTRTVTAGTEGSRKWIGNRTCINMLASKYLPALVRSTDAPDKALLSELSILRGSSTPIDRTSLGSWDRYPLLITTIFERYVRVFDAAENVKVAFLPVTYCNQTHSSRGS